MTLSVPTLLAVAAGGAAGAVCRYVTGVAALHWFGSAWPWGTFIVNVAGSVFMGMLIGAMALIWSPSPEVRALLVTGFLGAFTTFSTFSLDAVTLWQRGQELGAVAYVAASVVLGLAGLLAGMKLMKWVF